MAHSDYLLLLAAGLCPEFRWRPPPQQRQQLTGPRPAAATVHILHVLGALEDALNLLLQLFTDPARHAEAIRGSQSGVQSSSAVGPLCLTFAISIRHTCDMTIPCDQLRLDELLPGIGPTPLLMTHHHPTRSAAITVSSSGCSRAVPFIPPFVPSSHLG